ncbi:MAG: hypothetical protein IPK33_09050 [Gemmatimonadetes bacterium]|nr:hypothetical protein [Gemmatimonadota bacterium]
MVVRTDNFRFMLTRAEGRASGRVSTGGGHRAGWVVDLHGSLGPLRTQAISRSSKLGPVSRLSESALALALFREDRAVDGQLNNSGDE